MEIKKIIYSAPNPDFKAESYFLKRRRRKKSLMVVMEVFIAS
jgi:hypothetical protein